MPWLKIAGLILVLIPLAILLIFTVGETAGGDVSGLQHTIQVAPLALLAWWAWQRPLVGGWVLLIAAVIGAALYPFVLSDQYLRWTIIIDLLLFGPVIVAGTLFVVAARGNRNLNMI